MLPFSLKGIFCIRSKALLYQGPMPCQEYSVGILSLPSRALLKNPPAWSVDSYTVTEYPSCANSWAALNPAMPAPKMTIVFILFRCFSVKVLIVCLRFSTGMVDDAVPMIRGRVDRIELHWNSAGIDNIVIRPTRDNNSEACLNCCPNAIDNRFTGTLLHAKKLVGLMGFRPDFTLGI